MAKGDHQRLQNAVDYSTAHSQQPLSETRQRINEQGGPMWNNYMQGTQQNLADYNSIMGNYNNFMTGGGFGGQQSKVPLPSNLSSYESWTPESLNAYAASRGVNDPNFANYWMSKRDELFNRGKELNDPNYAAMRLSLADDFGGPTYGSGGQGGDPFFNSLMSALGGYGDFAKTGGFSPQDIQNIRARMIAPIRSIYSQGNAEVDRQRRLQHGYSPNYTAAKAKMAREQAYATSDATTNAEAAIAQMLQQGRLAGLGGLSQASLGGRGQNLSALGGQTSLYNATPGLSQTFGQQVYGNRQQDLEGQRLQQDLDEMRLRGQGQVAQTPGNFQSFLGNTAGLLGLIGQGASAVSGWPFGFGFGGGKQGLGIDTMGVGVPGYE